jgi:hypothetical protein
MNKQQAYFDVLYYLDRQIRSLETLRQRKGGYYASSMLQESEAARAALKVLSEPDAPAPEPKPTIAERLAQVEADLQAFKASHALAGGEPAQVLSPAEQDTKSYATIERWHTQIVGWPLTGVKTDGPFYDFGSNKYYICTTNDAPEHLGATRSDALAKLAQWCETELAAKAGK